MPRKKYISSGDLYANLILKYLIISKILSGACNLLTNVLEIVFEKYFYLNPNKCIDLG